MKKLKIYECVIKDGATTAYVEIIPAWDKKQLLDMWGGNGEFVSIKDISQEFPLDMNSIVEAISKHRFGEPEQDVIRRTLSLVLPNIINE